VKENERGRWKLVIFDKETTLWTELVRLSGFNPFMTHFGEFFMLD
jgi:hypothetical protein